MPFGMQVSKAKALNWARTFSTCGAAKPRTFFHGTEGELAHADGATHRNTIRFAPPLIIDESQVDWAVDRLTEVLEDVAKADILLR